MALRLRFLSHLWFGNKYFTNMMMVGEESLIWVHYLFSFGILCHIYFRERKLIKLESYRKDLKLTGELAAWLTSNIPDAERRKIQERKWKMWSWPQSGYWLHSLWFNQCGSKSISKANNFIFYQNHSIIFKVTTWLYIACTIRAIIDNI